ncbi:MAG: hypothetical protein SFU91_05220 [Chloroherpetonaceae bacterium]|nr:hypothetical protein [Chloroherpetonaceae bacterium]
MLSTIQSTHPLTHHYFSHIQNGEYWLKRIQEIDRYWSHVGLGEAIPPPKVLFSESELPNSAVISGEFDVIYSGATLGLLHAAALTSLYNKKILLIDKHTPAKTHRDWNISLRELQRLDAMGFMSLSESEKAITKSYKTGFVEFAAKSNVKRLFIDKVLDCAIDSDIILNHALKKVNSSEGNLVLGQTEFKRLFQGKDSVTVEVQKDGETKYYRAKAFADAMGVMSPLAMQLNTVDGFARPQTHVCPTVGTLASGLEGIDYDIGEILLSNEPAEAHRQLIWEGFPATNHEFTTYLFFYDKLESLADKSLLNLFEIYFEKLPAYKKPSKEFKIIKPVFGIIPAYHHDGFGKTRVTAAHRLILLGDAASLSSPLTFCGFGSMVRNLERTVSKFAEAFDQNDLSVERLSEINAYEPNVAIMSNLMKFMCYNESTDEPNFVNELMNQIMIVLDELPPRYRETMFRDEMSLQDFTTLILTVGAKYPKIFPITYQKLGISGSVSWLKNWTGWAAAEVLKR